MKRFLKVTAACFLSLSLSLTFWRPVLAAEEGRLFLQNIRRSAPAREACLITPELSFRASYGFAGLASPEEVEAETGETKAPTGTEALPETGTPSGAEAPLGTEAPPETEIRPGTESLRLETGQRAADLEAGAPSEEKPAADLGITARSALLMEASTGTVIYEKNADEALRPASITKIMTLILIFDAIRDGRITMEDQVTTSAYAKSMGGSQVFLEEGESQSVETLIKCIVIASGNDAAVTMAEYIAGSESEFVRMMNERAKALGMDQTNFEDCCGLTDSGTHLTSARDVAIMSRELITNYPEIEKYSTIWMENITHVTNQGSSEFCLSNTNKLLKMSNSFTVTGLKTGSTSLAKYCLSATAKKDGVELIAVIMAAPDYKVRFSEAASLLNYGFAGCRLYTDSDETRETLPRLAVSMGVTPDVPLRYEGEFSYLGMNGEDFSAVEKTVTLPEKLTAPVAEGDIVGCLSYTLNGKPMGTVNILAAEAVEAAGYGEYLKWMWEEMMFTGKREEESAR